MVAEQGPTESSIPLDPPVISTPSSFARLWRRVLALVLDGVILALFGSLLGLVLFELLTRLGAWGRLVGFLIALLYFGFLNSHMGGGQTIGKRAMRIRVQHADGSAVSVRRSFLRYSVLGIPIFANGIPLPTTRTPMPLMVLLALIVFGGLGATLYLFLFNRPARRSLHDLAAGTVVVTTPAGPLAPPRIWRGHLVILSVLALLLVALLSTSTLLLKQPMMSDLLRVLEAVESSEDVRSASVFSGRSWGPKGSGTYFKVTAVLQVNPASADDVSNRIAALVFDVYPQVAEVDQLWIGIAYGYDIGIARWYRQFNVLLPPLEWRDRLASRKGYPGPV